MTIEITLAENGYLVRVEIDNKVTVRVFQSPGDILFFLGRIMDQQGRGT